MNVAIGDVRVLVEAGAEVGEGPVVDRRSGELVWVDISRGELHRSHLENGTTATIALGTLLGAAVPRVDRDGFAVAVRDGFGLVEGDVLTMIDPLLADQPLRMNDAKCDARGRLWAGSTHMEMIPGAGRLHCWRGDGPSSVELEGLTLPNGIGWNTDATRMYVVDSLAGAIYGFDYDLDRGRMGARQVFAHVGDGVPDGLAVDTDGGVWVAVWDGYRVCRFDESGRVTDTVRMPVARPSSCAFLDGGRLAITSARSQEDLSGSVFVVEVGREGVAVGAFCG